MWTRPPSSPRQVLLLRQAPSPPGAGQTCNGCGLCCAAEPCPLGALVSGRRNGRCRALAWSADACAYRCRMISRPQALWPWLPRWTVPLVSRLARRWVAAGTRCDAELTHERVGP